jgi:hypothetical protein
MALLKIANGTLYDPVNGVDGVVKDLWIQDSRSSRRRSGG